MAVRLLFLITLVIGVCAQAWGQGFQASLIGALDANLEHGINDNCVNGTIMPGGIPVPDGTPINIYWDNDGNGPDSDDPQPLVGGGVGQVNFNSFLVNGCNVVGTCGTFATTSNFNSNGAIPSSPRYYLRICFQGLTLTSSVVTLSAGPSEALMTQWSCSYVCGMCLAQPPGQANGLIATSDCDNVALIWQSAPRSASYAILRNADTLSVQSGFDTTFIDTAPTDIPSLYRILPVNSCGSGVISNSASGYGLRFITEEFDTEFMPTGWIFQHLGNTQEPWHIVDDGSGNYAAQTSLTGVAATASERLISTDYDFTIRSNLMAKFRSTLVFNSQTQAVFSGSIDGGFSWPYTLADLTTNHDSTLSINLPAAFYGAANARFRWRFNASGAGAASWVMDDFRICGQTLDTIPPTPVDSLAFSGFRTETAIQLVWMTANDAHFSSYQIFYDTNPGVTEADFLWDKSDDALMADPATYYSTITGLDTATIYYFICRAADSAGNGGAFSNEVLVSTLGATPRAPTGLVIQKQGNHARFAWSPVTEDTLGQPTIVAGYRLYVHPYSQFAIDPEYYLDETADTSYVVPNVFSLPSSYFFAVTAVGDNTPILGSGAKRPPLPPR